MKKKLTHWQYDKIQCIWEKVRTCFAGEDEVKCKGEEYQPKPLGMKKSADGAQMYADYVMRAIFYEYPSDIAASMFGLLNKEESNVEIGENARLKAFKDNMDGNGSDAQMILQEMHKDQLSVGRGGYLLDSTNKAGFNVTPHALKYSAESIINWNYHTDDTGKLILDLVMLNESGFELLPTGEWDNVEKYRVCVMDGNKFTTYRIDKLEDFDASVIPVGASVPLISGKALGEIPFVFYNSSSTNPDIEIPFILPVCNMSLSLYRRSAVYEQTMYEQSQETLVGIGLTPEEVKGAVNVGTGAVIKSTNKEAKWFYVGISGEGLAETRLAQDDLHKRITDRGVTLMDAGQESGEALSIRMTAKTSQLRVVAETAAEALTKIITLAADWMAVATDDVEVTPNTDFADSTVPVKDMLDLWSVRQLGAPLSRKSWHAELNRRGLTELTFDEEEEEINQEEVE